MPSIYIRETDNTIYGLSTVNSDNIVFVPGSATTGPSDNPILIGSVEEFVNTFGPSAPESSDRTVGSSWDYAYGLLYAGMPVLYKRITQKVNGADVTELTKKASANVLDNYSDSGSATTVAKVEAMYGGSYGNQLNYSVEISSTAYYFKVYRANKLLENVRLISVTEDDDEESIKEKLLAAIPTKTFQNITLEIVESAKDSFKLVAAEHVYLSGGEDANEADILEQLPKEYEVLEDKYVYDVKFLTSGGYYDADKSTTSISDSMIDLAEKRMDCVAIPDIPIGLAREEVTSFFTRSTSYAAVYAPWIYMRLPDRSEKWMPPSFVFMYTLAKSVSSGNNLWVPPAGVTRASVPEAIKAEYEIGGTTLEKWQETNPQSINPIMQLRQYGYVIYGQRTLYSQIEGSTDYRSALQELGVRIVVNEIKRAAFNISLALTFDQNTIRTWNEFRGRLDPILAQMKADRGIIDYQIIMDETVISTEDIDQNRIRGVIRVSVTRALEDFDITFELEPSAVTFSDDGDQFII